MSETASNNMNLAHGESLVRELELYPKRVPAYYAELESAIKWLMDNTYKEADADRKTRMAATELRVRLVLKRYRGTDAN